MKTLILCYALLSVAPQNDVSEQDKLITIRQAIDVMEKLQKNGMAIPDFAKDTVKSSLVNEAELITKGKVATYDQLLKATQKVEEDVKEISDMSPWRLLGLSLGINILLAFIVLVKWLKK